MKLSYFELLSPEPVYVSEVGGILSPKLKDISSIGVSTYQYFLSILLMDIKTYFSMTGQEQQFEALSEKEKSQITIFDLLTANEQSIALLQNAFNFFIREDVVYSPLHKCFCVQKTDADKQESQVIGTITKEIYPQVCDLICQRCFIKTNQEEDLTKVKNKKALEIMKKLQKGRAEKARQTKTDQNMELGNIISAVANKSQSLNILNIWELTVYQLWDCFARLSNNTIYNIQSMSVAAWGNKDNTFDASSWFKRIDSVN